MIYGVQLNSKCFIMPIRTTCESVTRHQYNSSVIFVSASIKLTKSCVIAKYISFHSLTPFYLYSSTTFIHMSYEHCMEVR